MSENPDSDPYSTTRRNPMSFFHTLIRQLSAALALSLLCHTALAQSALRLEMRNDNIARFYDGSTVIWSYSARVTRDGPNITLHGAIQGIKTHVALSIFFWVFTVIIGCVLFWWIRSLPESHVRRNPPR